MGDIRMTRDFFLWCMSCIYLFAFASLYAQLPGLYGSNGILPAKHVLNKEAKDVQDLVETQPSLLRLLPRLGIEVHAGMDLICLAGVIFAFVAMTTRAMRNSFVFFGLWIFYLSMFQVGQTFLWFQWDTLLLETGFLTILLAPLTLWSLRRPGSHQHDRMMLWLLRWLLFRLMFASGVVKLTSQCPTWWGLTALNYHYESQCIPTPAAWFFHQLPDWFQKFSVVMTFIIEIPIPFLFFSPVRSQRIFAFFAQLLLQILIILTGNYNFFNLLTITLCIALLDDNFLRSCMGKRPRHDRDDPATIAIIGTLWRLVTFILNIAVYSALIYFAVVYFSLRIAVTPSIHIDSKIAFTSNDLDLFLQRSVPISIVVGAVSLAWEMLKALKRSLINEKGGFRKLRNLLGCVLFGILAAIMFSISLVPLTQGVLRDYQQNLPSQVFELHGHSRPYKLTSPYGLFRSMTGVGGRPEVIIEGSNSMNSGWKEYNFLYKPGNISTKLPFVAPHQPRLDWQLWFAALGSYQHNPWFLNLCYRLLQGQPEVLDLIGENPFPDQPPKFIRAYLYHYHFTSIDKSHENYDTSNWWVRKRVSDYLPTISLSDPSFTDYLKRSGIYDNPATQRKAAAKPDNFIVYVLDTIRSIIGQPEGFTFVISIFAAGLILTFLDPNVRLLEWHD